VAHYKPDTWHKYLKKKLTKKIRSWHMVPT